VPVKPIGKLISWADINTIVMKYAFRVISQIFKYVYQYDMGFNQYP